MHDQTQATTGRSHSPGRRVLGAVLLAAGLPLLANAILRKVASLEGITALATLGGHRDTGSLVLAGLFASTLPVFLLIPCVGFWLLAPPGRPVLRNLARVLIGFSAVWLLSLLLFAFSR